MRSTRAVIVVLAASVLLSAVPAAGQTWSTEQQEVWAQEQAFWEMFRVKDLEGVMAVFHPDYKGWDYSAAVPSGTESNEIWMKYYFDNYSWVVIEITPLAIVVSGDIAVVHYVYAGVYSDDEGEKEGTSGRWTDVLKKEDGKWLLIADHGGSTKDDD